MAAPTHRRIAQLAGVSQAAVSLALRGDPKISAPTRARIEEAATRLGYRTNPLVAALMAQQRSARPVRYRATLGFVYTQFTRDITNDRIVGLYFRGARACAAELGYTLEPFWLTEPGMTEKRISEILLNRGVHGLILAPLALQPPASSTVASELDAGRLALRWDAFATVALGFTLRDPDLDRAAHDSFHGMTQLMQRLTAAGYRRIGLAMDPRHDARVHHLRLAGYLAFSHTLPKRAQLPPFIPPREHWSSEGLLEWFDRHSPDALIGMDAQPRDWLVQAQRHRGAAPLAYASCCWLPSRQCAGWYENYEELGAAAASMVAAKLQRNEFGVPRLPHELLIKGEWKEGTGLTIPPTFHASPAVAGNRRARVTA